MSQENLDAHLAAVDAFNRRDLEELLGWMAEDIRLHSRFADVDTRVFEGHAGIRTRRLRLAAIYAMGTIAPHESLDVALGLDGSSEAVGRRFFGGAVQASLLPFTRSRSKWARSLEPFARFDETDTQDGVGAAGTENPAHHWTTLGVGVRGRPLESVFLTLEREQRGNESHTAIGRWEAALAIAFDGPATPRRAGER